MYTEQLMSLYNYDLLICEQEAKHWPQGRHACKGRWDMNGVSPHYFLRLTENGRIQWQCREVYAVISVKKIEVWLRNAYLFWILWDQFLSFWISGSPQLLQLPSFVSAYYMVLSFHNIHDGFQVLLMPVVTSAFMISTPILSVHVRRSLFRLIGLRRCVRRSFNKTESAQEAATRTHFELLKKQWEGKLAHHQRGLSSRSRNYILEWQVEFDRHLGLINDASIKQLNTHVTINTVLLLDVMCVQRLEQMSTGPYRLCICWCLSHCSEQPFQ